MSFTDNPQRDIDEALPLFNNLSISENRNQSSKMDANLIQTLLNTAIKQAVDQTKSELQATINELTNRVSSLEPISKAEDYKEIELTPGVQCDETLDIVKSIPEFKGDATKYVSWRQAAVTAHKLFKPYAGSSKYYQAVAILRNKVIGSADAVLSSYNTVLNFDAILARLDFAYSDKKSIYTLEQELSTLRQGQKSIIQFYDEVERKLSAIVNKVIMSNENNPSLIQSLNQKYRQDALRVFVSGLKKPLCDTLFSCKPADMPTALALAQELETNQNRYHFAAIYSNGLNKASTSPLVLQHTQNHSNQSGPKPVNFNQQSGNPQGQIQFPTTSNTQMRPQQTFNQPQRFPQNQNGQGRQSFRAPFPPQPFNHQQPTQQIDTDVSMRTVRSNNFPDIQREKRALSTDKHVPRKVQRINFVCDNMQPDEYSDSLEQPNDPTEEFDSSLPFEDEINFLGESPSSHTLSEQ